MAPLEQVLANIDTRLAREQGRLDVVMLSGGEPTRQPTFVAALFAGGVVRLVMIGGEGKIDLQPCGGTHVRSTAEIGPIRVAKIENKGKINRRIRLAFA